MKILLLHSQTDIAASDAFAEELVSISGIEICGQIGFPAERQNLPETDVVLLLLSDSFLSDDVQNDLLLDDALAMDSNLIAVVLKKCDWDESPYLGLAILPEDRVAIETQGFASIQDSLSKMIHVFHLKQNTPDLYARLHKQEVKQESKPSFLLLSTRIIWRLLPQKIKWPLTALLVVSILLLIYFWILT